jgi:hypothetical protein
MYEKNNDPIKIFGSYMFDCTCRYLNLSPDSIHRYGYSKLNYWKPNKPF